MMHLWNVLNAVVIVGFLFGLRGGGGGGDEAVKHSCTGEVYRKVL